MTLIINAFQSRVEGPREDLRFSSSPQPLRDYAAQRKSAGLFWYAADESLLADDVYRNSPNDRQVVGCIIPKGCKVPSPEMPEGPRPDGISSTSPSFPATTGNLTARRG